MIALAMVTIWAGYTLSVWGVCLLKGYNVQFTDLFGQAWPGVGVQQQAPTGGHKLGTITGNAQVTPANPGG